MAGCYEIRVTGPGRRHYLACLHAGQSVLGVGELGHVVLDNAVDDHNLRPLEAPVGEPLGRAVRNVRDWVLPKLVLSRLASQVAAVFFEMAFELALLHAAISTASTSAHPVAGIGSPRERRSASTSSIASRTIARASSSPSPCVWTSGSSGTWA